MRLSYSQLLDELKDAPMTWVPGLLTAVVKRALILDVFKPGAIAAFVADAERVHDHIRGTADR